MRKPVTIAAAALVLVFTMGTTDSCNAPRSGTVQDKRVETDETGTKYRLYIKADKASLDNHTKEYGWVRVSEKEYKKKNTGDKYP